MRIDKQSQLDILIKVNNVLKEEEIEAAVYLFGGNSLISQDIISRSTKDLDLFMSFVFDSPDELVNKIKAQFDFRVDIRLNGVFNIESKGYSWVLPKNAYKRAKSVCAYSNINVYALSPLDIVVLKCDRLNERDQRDISAVFNMVRPSRNDVISVFEEYGKLLEGNKSSIENIRENFYQPVLTIYDQTLKK